eukprot:g39523.t1
MHKGTATLPGTEAVYAAWNVIEQAHQGASEFITILDDSGRWDRAIRSTSKSPSVRVLGSVSTREAERVLALRRDFKAVELYELSDASRDTSQRKRIDFPFWGQVDSVKISGLHSLQLVAPASAPELTRLTITHCSRATELPGLSLYPKLRRLDVHDTVIANLPSALESLANDAETLQDIGFTLRRGARTLSDYLGNKVQPQVLRIHHRVAQSGRDFVLEAQETSTLDKLTSLHLNQGDRDGKVALTVESLSAIASQAYTGKFKELCIVGFQLGTRLLMFLKDIADCRTTDTGEPTKTLHVLCLRRCFIGDPSLIPGMVYQP